MTYAQPMADPTSIVGRRIGAWAIDLIIYLIISFAIGLAAGPTANESREFPTSAAAEQFCDQWRAEHSGICFHADNGDGATASAIETNLLTLSWFPLHFVLFSILQGVTGGSLGKLAVGLRVVTADGRRAGVGRSFLRTAFWVVDAITCALPIVGGILILSSKGHRRVGDMVAKTFVVPMEQEGTPIYVPGLTTGPPPGYQPAPQGGSYGYGPSASDAGPSTATWGTPAAPSAPLGDGPSWDAARNAYIQYDAGQGAWLQWDDATSSWKPIDQ